jgi:hypothetical protein
MVGSVEIATRTYQLDAFSTRIIAGLYVNEYLRECPSGMVYGVQVPSLPKTVRLKRSINEIICGVALELTKPDIVHETYYSSRRLAPKSSRIILTVYDMIHEKFADSLPTL